MVQSHFGEKLDRGWQGEQPGEHGGGGLNDASAFHQQPGLACSILNSKSPPISDSMKATLIRQSLILLMLWGTAIAFGQTAGAPAVHGPTGPQYSVQGSVASSGAAGQGIVSYASVSQVNGLLSQLEASSKATQADLMKLRIERWKTDGSSKKQALGNVDSIQRNLQSALAEIIAQVRNAPEDLPATFKLYRNLDALYDVMGSVVESTGAFGPKDDFQSLSNDLNSFEATRRQLGERLANLAASKEQEIARLRTDLKAAQAAISAAPPKKTVVDDNEPAKKPAPKKKPAAKKPAGAAPAAPGQNSPAQQPKQ
jgi:hypothetical protein